MKILGQEPLLGTPLIKGHPSAKGLVSFLLMNEGAGDKAADSSGNGNIGTLENGASWTKSPYGNGVLLEGNNQHIDCGSPASLDFGAGDFTICMLICPKNISGVFYYALVTKWSPDGFILQLRGTGILRALVYGLTANDVINLGASATVVNNQWYYLTFVIRNGHGNCYSYQNGVQVGSGVCNAGSISDALNFEIGIYGSTGDFPGIIAGVWAYNRALSPSEVRQLYLSPFCMFERKPIALWSAATGVSVKDYTRGDVAALPADDTNLETAFSSSDYDDVASDNALRVSQLATGEYSVFLFKDKHTGQENIGRKWNGQSDRAPSDSTVYLQIYNRNTPGWETIASNNAAAADIDFDLQGEITENLAYYFDASNWIACRVYQEAV